MELHEDQVDEEAVRHVELLLTSRQSLVNHIWQKTAAVVTSRLTLCHAVLTVVLPSHTQRLMLVESSWLIVMTFPTAVPSSSVCSAVTAQNSGSAVVECSPAIS